MLCLGGLGVPPEQPMRAADLGLLSACADALAGALARTLRYEEMVRQAREHRQILDHLPVIVFHWDSERMRPRYLSAGIRQILGYTPEEALHPGAAISWFLDPDERFTVALDEHLRTGAPMPWLDARVRHKDGREVLLRITLFPAGQRRDLEGIAVDVTAEREAQRQLLAADRLAALGLLAAGVGHEINNPSAFIALGVQQLRRLVDRVRAADGHDASAHLDRMGPILDDMEEGVKRIAAIVSELRLFARAPDATGAATDLNALLRSAALLVETALRSRARLDLRLGELPPQPGRYQPLAQVFLNLLLHAAQSIPPGDPTRHQVRVESGCEGGAIRVAVSDTGPSIPEALLPRVFDPFFSARPHAEGTGLGLALSYDLVKRLGGRLDARSRDGEGTTFTVWLPSLPLGVREEPADAPSQTPGAAPAQPPATAPAPQLAARLLVVEDTLALAESIAAELETGFHVEVAGCAEEALERLAAGWFDAVLCDLRMPGLSGAELFSRVRARDPRQAARFVFVTGAAPEDRTFLADSGCPVLEKPFASQALWRAVERAVKT
jgi:PAS domain S-box-containing protein